MLEPSIANRIVVVWIGGHPRHWPHARDFNLKQDIAAAQVLFDCGVPLIQIPAGDVAASLSITLPELESGLAGHSPIATRLYGSVERYYTEAGAQKNLPRCGRNAWTKVILDIATIAWLVAPEPWGPWTVVEYDDHWGQGKIEVSAFYWNLPTKWQSADGRQVTTVFTGKNTNDSWNTVTGTFIIRPTRQP